MSTIKEIQQRLELVTDLADPFLAEAANDQRSEFKRRLKSVKEPFRRS